MESLKEKSIKGLFWDFSGRIGLQGVGFIVSIILARLLAPEEFGLMAIITVFINLSWVFIDFGFGAALIQKQDVKKEHFSAVFYLNILTGVLFATIVFLLAPLIGRFYEKDILTNITRVMSLGIFISSFGNVIRASLQRDMKFKTIALVDIVAAVIGGTVAICMAFKGFGIWSLAVQSVTTQVLAIAFLYIFCRVRINLEFNLPALRELWGFSSHLFFSRLLDTLFQNIDSLIIGKILSPATLGFYHRAKSLENFGFRYSAATFTNVLFPSLSSLQDDVERFKQAVLKVFHLLSIISFFLSGILLVSGHELIIILFSEKWEPSIKMFQILIAGGFAPQGFSLFYNVLLSRGNTRKYLFINVLFKILLLLNLSLLFYSELNLYLIGFVVVQIFIYYYTMFQISNQLSFGKQLFGISLKNIIIFTFSTCFVFMIKAFFGISNLYFSLIISVICFVMFFLLFYYLLNREELKIASSELSFNFRKMLKRETKSD